MSTFNGSFIWYERMTLQQDATEKFYCRVLRWHATDGGQPNMRYTVMSTGADSMNTGVGGVMTIPEQMRSSAKPGWMGHIGVDDVDGTLTRLRSLGGTIHRPGTDIPGIGRFAMVADPQGAAFMIFAPKGDTSRQPPPDITPGRVGWRELMTNDWKAGYAFYSELFGWKKDMTVDMGPQYGTYQTWKSELGQGGGQGGGMMNDPQGNAPAWRFYFSVESVEAAMDRIKSAGGKCLTEAMPVPGGGYMCNALDDEGVPFSVTGPKS